jgi:myosin-1
VTEFIDKNQDSLFQDLKRMLYECKTPALQEMFPEGADDINKVHKNPYTAAMGFKMSMAKLVDLLAEKEPFYVRCIKPNPSKSANSFDDKLVDHQVRYLGLMENLRVRRAGYCNRQLYEIFVARYKMLSARTWPVWRKDMKEGTAILIETLGLNKAVAFGKTKLFVKEPSTLYLIEQKREEAIPLLVTKIQAEWRGFLARRFVKKLRAYTKICRWWRKVKSKAYFTKVLNTFKDVAGRPDLGKRLPWPTAMPGAGPFEKLSRRIHTQWWTAKVLERLASKKKEIELKMPAFDIMRNRRSNWGVNVPWLGNYCAKGDDSAKFGAGVTAIFEKRGDGKVEFSSKALLLDKKGKQQDRAIVVSNKSIYVVDTKKWKVADKLMFAIDDVTSITVSTGEDQLVVIKVPGGTDIVVKLVGKALSAELVCAILRGCKANISVKVTDNITVNLKGKESTIEMEVADANKSEFKASKLGVRLVTRKTSVMMMQDRLSPDKAGGAAPAP